MNPFRWLCVSTLWRKAANGVKLKVEFPTDTTTVVRGMEIKLRQVLLNLVGNALKFTDSGGSITIRVRTDEEPSASSTVSESPTPARRGLVRCAFEVEDNGIGVEAENSALLFEPFHQAEQGGAVSRRHSGTGLGLTICRDLVDVIRHRKPRT